MELIGFLLQVFFGAFAMFMIAHMAYMATVVMSDTQSIKAWVATVIFLALLNMLIHRLLGSTINPPFFAALLFASALYGQPTYSQKAKKWGLAALAAGTVLGWVTYIQSGSVS